MGAEKTKVKSETGAKAKKTPKAPQASAETPSSEVSVTSAQDNRNSLQSRRLVEGVVVSDKMTKTIVVKVDRRVRHAFYKKYVVRSRRFKAHDEKNDAKVGDWVSLVESRPLSRNKRWVLCKIIRRAGQAPEANV